MSGAFLSVHGLRKRYRGVGGVADVSLEVDAGECVAVTGPSGSGKTTLLRIVAGLEIPDAGDVWLDGEQVAAPGRSLIPANRRRVGFVFQDLALWPHLTVTGNLAFVAGSTGVRRAERPAVIDAALRRCHVDPALDRRYPHELSGGEQQRVAVARALVGSPRVLLLDEPFSSLDRELRRRLRDELAQLRRALGITTVFVTHDAEDAVPLADRLLVMRDGVLHAVTS